MGTGGGQGGVGGAGAERRTRQEVGRAAGSGSGIAGSSRLGPSKQAAHCHSCSHTCPRPAPPVPACSKGGNNNTYCHDSALNWLDWSKANADDEGLLRFTRHMIGLRCGRSRVALV